jgi:LysM repeat protein
MNRRRVLMAFAGILLVPCWCCLAMPFDSQVPVRGILNQTSREAQDLATSLDALNANPDFATASEAAEILKTLGELEAVLIKLRDALAAATPGETSPGGEPEAAMPTSAPSTTSAPGTPTPRIHRVQPGDTLSALARQYHGSSALYWEIVELNKDRYPSIAKNPDLIYPGWDLLLPESPGPATRAPNSSPPSSTASSNGRLSVLNNLRYGINRLQEKIGSRDPTLGETIAWVTPYLQQLKGFQNPQDTSLIEFSEAALARARSLRTTSSASVPASLASGMSIPESPASGISISEHGQQQMRDVVHYALNHHKGSSDGWCFNAVWGYLVSSGYGKLRAWNDLPRMQSGQARFFAEYLNARPAHLDEAGLQRLDRSLQPPITNPHDSRIPLGAVIVVAANSTGTSDPEAGDIVIKAGPNRFVNDGPNMYYGTASTWRGRLLGVYVPR